MSKFKFFLENHLPSERQSAEVLWSTIANGTNEQVKSKFKRGTKPCQFITVPRDFLTKSLVLYGDAEDMRGNVLIQTNESWCENTKWR